MITQDDLPQKYQHLPLIKAEDGTQNSVYLLGDKYALKLYDAPYQKREEEIALLHHLRTLPVARYVEDCTIKGFVGFFYEQIGGESILHPEMHHIEKIGYFLKALHQRTAHLTSRNKNIFDAKKLKKLLKKKGFSRFENYLSRIDIELQNNGIIHGDLFVDNVKWHHDTLSGVYDFSEACCGDFIFDVAVVAVSWCFESDAPNYEKIERLCSSYGLVMPLQKFKEYMKYALLYYAVKRYCEGRGYEELLVRLEKL